MISEAIAGMNAKELEKILLVAINENDDVKKFAKQYLYHWYKIECSDSFSEVNKEIKDFFENFKS